MPSARFRCRATGRRRRRRRVRCPLVTRCHRGWATVNSDNFDGFKNLGVFCAALALGILGGIALLAVCCGAGVQVALWLKAIST